MRPIYQNSFGESLIILFCIGCTTGSLMFLPSSNIAVLLLLMYPQCCVLRSKNCEDFSGWPALLAFEVCVMKGVAPPRVINLYVIEQKPQQWAQERLSHLFLWRKEDFFNYFAYLFWLSGNPVGVMIANVLAPAFVTKKSNIPQMVGRTC